MASVVELRGRAASFRVAADLAIDLPVFGKGKVVCLPEESPECRNSRRPRGLSMAEGVAVSSSLLQGTSKKCTGILWAGDGGAHSGVGTWYPLGTRVWLASQSKVLGTRREQSLLAPPRACFPCILL